MIIQKVLNHNAAIVKEGNEEKVALGAGLAFHKKRNDTIDPARIEKLFVLKEKEQDHFTHLLHSIKEEEAEVIRKIVKKAESELNATFNERIYIALFDHIIFTIERVQTGQSAPNYLLPEIKGLYPDEFKVGLWAAEAIEKMTGTSMSEDEAGFIALHLYTARNKHPSVEETMNLTEAIHLMVEVCEESLGVTFPTDTVAYQGLITHLNIAIKTVIQQEDISSTPSEMVQMIKKGYPEVYQSTQAATEALKKEYGLLLPEDENVYISMHIQRILVRIKEEENNHA